MGCAMGCGTSENSNTNTKDVIVKAKPLLPFENLTY